MTAATNTASRSDWAWPLNPPSAALKNFMQTSPPLELQFLPPSPAADAAASSSRRTDAPALPWTVDPSRLQKLMMGSLATSSDRLPAPASHNSVSDFGLFFDPAGVSKPLPSGWERCLDLKSGEVFIKKCEMMTSKTGTWQRFAGWQALITIDTNQSCWRSTGTCGSAVHTDDQRADWAPSWLLGKSGFSSQTTTTKGISTFRKVDAKVCGEDERPSSPDRSSLCLDLDLRLSGNSCRLVSEAPEYFSSPSVKPASSLLNSRDYPGPSRLLTEHETERSASIQEMVSESTMATAVCAKCLMYVLLKKSNPTCPRCFNPIILDCDARTSVNKRPRLDLFT